jgi:uncharacterized protein
MENILLFVVSLFLILAGLAGVILPLLPGGIFVSWLGYFIFAVFTHFQKISLASTLIFLGVAVIVSIFDFLVPFLGAKKYQASKYGMLGAFLGSVFGVLVFGIPGLVIGPLAGAALGELFARKKPEEAAKTALGVLVGFLAGALVKIVFIFIMIGFLFVQAF